MRKLIIPFLEVVEITVIALGAVFLIRGYLIQPFLVSGGSMSPTFSNGDYLLVNELTYRFREPIRGEVVVFHYPNNKTTYFIKRIIGLPDETVQIKDGKVTILSGNKPREIVLNENYLISNIKTSGNLEYKLGSSQYFVLGDNRSYSFDSRSWGPVDAREIVGAVGLRLWPVGEIKVFAAPQY